MRICSFSDSKSQLQGVFRLTFFNSEHRYPSNIGLTIRSGRLSFHLRQKIDCFQKGRFETWGSNRRLKHVHFSERQSGGSVWADRLELCRGLTYMLRESDDGELVRLEDETYALFPLPSLRVKRLNRTLLFSSALSSSLRRWELRSWFELICVRMCVFSRFFERWCIELNWRQSCRATEISFSRDLSEHKYFIWHAEMLYYETI